MKLIHEIIIRRLDVMKDLELNNESLKAIWHFYEVYKICLNFLGRTDTKLRIKQKLIKKLINDNENVAIINDLKSFMSEDSQVIEITLNSINEDETVEEVIDDFYPSDVFGVHIYDRA